MDTKRDPSDDALSTHPEDLVELFPEDFIGATCETDSGLECPVDVPDSSQLTKPSKASD